MTVNPVDSTILGGLFGSDALRAVFAEQAWLQRLLDVEAALARVQAGIGIIPEAAARAIAAAARVELIPVDEIAASTKLVGYPVVALTKALARTVGPEAGRYVHWGATTQDILDTALVLQLREALDLLRRDARRLVRALVALAQRHRDVAMAGRTHLQHALPVTFGYKCAIWAAPLLDDMARLDALRPRLLKVQFGGAVGSLASLGDKGSAVTEALAEELGLAAPVAPWHAIRDSLAELAAALGVLAGNLAKFATDIVLLMQTEVGEAFEPHQPGRGGSSTMPQKRNPIASEYVLAAARGIHALVPLLLGTMAQDQERSTGPWQAEQLALPQIVVLAGGALAHAVAIAEGLTIDAARMRHNLELTHGLIMAEAAMMALAERIGRQKAHDAVEHACARALAEGVSLAQALRKEPMVAGAIDGATIDRLADPRAYLGECGAVVDRMARKAAALLGPVS
ncbi:MAG: 3-carboxy-cis,cis-muconate cycloisomerase [Alphaproteobacteria bacterium]|nr:3-carboxy-cis,cis-muconate cycloisomerase [Alphaproteobacteria bacterium]